MQVSVETTSELSRKMTVQLPEEKIQEEMDNRLKSLAQTVRIDGFRPGKVPQRVIRSRFSSRVREEVAAELIQSSFYNALQENDLRPAGTPTIKPRDAGAGQGLEYEASFEVYPEISLNPLEELEIKRPQATVADSDVDAMLERLRKQQKTWGDVERAAHDGDRLTINFSGRAGDEDFTNGLVEDFEVVLGEGRMIPGFEEQLGGCETGEHRQISVTFPEDYHEAKLAGKAADFEIDVLKVQEPVIPELDQAFAEGFGIKEGGVEALRADVRENMEKELAQAIKGQVKSRVMDALLEKNPFTLPSILVQEEVDRLAVPYRTASKKGGEEPEIPTEQLEQQARRRVALGLILADIIQKNELKADKGKVREAVEDLARSYEQPEDVVNWYYSNEEQLNQVEQMVLEDQVVEWVLTKVQVTDEPVAFDEIMKPNS